MKISKWRWWWRHFTGFCKKNDTRALGKQFSRHILLLEALEDRTLLSVSSPGIPTWLSQGPGADNVTGTGPGRGGQLLLAGTNAGLQASLDGGASWFDSGGLGASNLPTAVNVRDLKADPGNPNQFYATVPGLGVFRGVYNTTAPSIVT